MKLLAKNQAVGDGQGYAMLRDLYEEKDGTRISIRKTEWLSTDDSKRGKCFIWLIPEPKPPTTL